jgi:hypothetical protein
MTGFSKATPGYAVSVCVERQDVRQPVIAVGVGEYIAGGTSGAA